MNFKYKSAIQTILSQFPKGELGNYWMQRHISKSLPTSNRVFLHKIKEAYNHFQKFEEYNQLQNNSFKYYEFGAGWTLSIPLTISLLGFDVKCIDIRKLVIPELINDSIYKLRENEEKLPFTPKKEISETYKGKDILNFLQDQYNLEYIAPKDAIDTGFESESFDFISSTETFEHLPKEIIAPILKESFRILKKGGIMSIYTDYKDHWAYFDKSINFYNFLQYSDQEWKKYNPSLHFQNRLRHSDFMNFFKNSDFKIVEEIPIYPSEHDKNGLKNIHLSSEFKRYDSDDVGIRGSYVVLLKE